MKFMTESGEVEKVYIDGYPVGDRLLEGVMFECVIRGERVVVTGVTPTCEAYFDCLNRTKWIREVEEFAQTRDLFCVDPSGSGDDAWIEK